MFFEFNSFIMLTPFKPRASFVEIPITTGFPFRRVAFAAINTGLSVAALANLLMEFPVMGAMTIQSRGFLAPTVQLPQWSKRLFPPPTPRFFHPFLPGAEAGNRSQNGMSNNWNHRRTCIAKICNFRYDILICAMGSGDAKPYSFTFQQDFLLLN